MSLEDDTYSTIFTALKHPIRRRILCILNQTPITYTDIQTQLGIDNGLLNYHLDNMRDLITKNGGREVHALRVRVAAVNLTERVEEALRRRESTAGFLSTKYLEALTIVLLISVASLSGLYLSLNNNYQSQTNTLSQKTVELEVANQRLNSLSGLVELANISEPATWGISGTQIVKGFSMSYTYLEQGGTGNTGMLYNPVNNTARLGVTGTVDDASTVVVFYNPTDGAIAHIELAVNPVNVKPLELTVQSSNAWSNESWVNVGTRGEWFNISVPQ